MRRHLLKKREESDPMGVVSNLFDVAMVFAVALMVALVTRYSMTEMFSQEDFTIVKNPGKEDMEIITKEGGKVNRYTRRHSLRARERRNHLRPGIAISGCCRRRGAGWQMPGFGFSRFAICCLPLLSSRICNSALSAACGHKHPSQAGKSLLVDDMALRRRCLVCCRL